MYYKWVTLPSLLRCFKRRWWHLFVSHLTHFKGNRSIKHLGYDLLWWAAFFQHQHLCLFLHENSNWEVAENELFRLACAGGMEAFAMELFSSGNIDIVQRGVNPPLYCAALGG